MKEFALVKISKNKYVVARLKTVLDNIPQYEQISKPMFDKDAFQFIQGQKNGKKKVSI